MTTTRNEGTMKKDDVYELCGVQNDNQCNDLVGCQVPQNYKVLISHSYLICNAVSLAGYVWIDTTHVFHKQMLFIYLTMMKHTTKSLLTYMYMCLMPCTHMYYSLYQTHCPFCVLINY